MNKVQTAKILDIESDSKNNVLLKTKENIKNDVRPNYSRDHLLTDFGKATLLDRYLLPGEKFQDMFLRVAKQYSDDFEHCERIYNYISKLWFMPATPVLSNGGAKNKESINNGKFS